jgi:multidrug efflux pump subunit AcrB
MAILIAVLGAVSVVTMSTDVFPSIDIPVISVIWSYGGLSPTEMQDRITTVVERALTTTVNDIEHMEALMGCIMSIGVATSNSILMVTFANEQRQPEFGRRDALAAAQAAGRRRLVPAGSVGQ